MLCKFCHKSYNTKTVLKRHLHLHLDKCTNQIEQDTIQTEIKLLKERVSIKNIICELCGNKYVDKYNLQNHQKKTCIYPNVQNLLERGADKFTATQVVMLVNLLINKHSGEFTHVQADKLVNLIINKQPISPQTESNVRPIIDNRHQIINNGIINNDNRAITINVVNIGEENLQMLKDKSFLDQILHQIESNKDYYGKTDDKTLKNILVETYRKVNCNPDYPENHNLYKGNKNPYTPFYIKIDDKWLQTTDLDYVRKIIKDKKNQVTQGMAASGNGTNKEQILDAYMAIDSYLAFQEDIPKKICHEILQIANEHKNIIKKTYERDK